MTKHYLDIDYKNMCFYEYSKEAQEGFEEHTNGAGTVSYRKLYKKGVFGVLQSISIADTTHQGKKLVFRLLQGEDIFLAGFSLYDQRGNFDNRFIEPIIAILPNLVKEQAYRIFPWSIESETAKNKKGEPRKFYGVSIKEADLDNLTVGKDDEGKVLPKYVHCKKDETFDAKIHLPQLEFVEQLGAWKPTAVSVDAKTSFLVGLLEQGLKDLGYVPNDQTAQAPAQEAAKPAAKAKAKPAAKAVQAEIATAVDIAAPAEDLEEEDYDDLPF